MPPREKTDPDDDDPWGEGKTVDKIQYDDPADDEDWEDEEEDSE